MQRQPLSPIAKAIKRFKIVVYACVDCIKEGRCPRHTIPPLEVLCFACHLGHMLVGTRAAKRPGEQQSALPRHQLGRVASCVSTHECVGEGRWRTLQETCPQVLRKGLEIWFNIVHTQWQWHMVGPYHMAGRPGGGGGLRRIRGIGVGGRLR